MSREGRIEIIQRKKMNLTYGLRYIYIARFHLFLGYSLPPLVLSLTTISVYTQIRV